jgi:hypothetical protein
VVWADYANGEIRRASANGGGSVLLSSANSLAGIAASADRVYWIETSSPGGVHRVSVRGGDAVTLGTGELVWDRGDGHVRLLVARTRPADVGARWSIPGVDRLLRLRHSKRINPDDFAQVWHAIQKPVVHLLPLN